MLDEIYGSKVALLPLLHSRIAKGKLNRFQESPSVLWVSRVVDM
jgi:hypothetical protein